MQYQGWLKLQHNSRQLKVLINLDAMFLKQQKMDNQIVHPDTLQVLVFHLDLNL